MQRTCWGHAIAPVDIENSAPAVPAQRGRFLTGQGKLASREAGRPDLQGIAGRSPGSRSAANQPMTTTAASPAQVLYWHRELPPLRAEVVGEHILEATSRRVPGRFSGADEEWSRCYGDLMTQARARLTQEVARLGGDYAHVGEEVITPRHDAALGEGWLYGRFNYVLYRDPERGRAVSHKDPH